MSRDFRVVPLTAEMGEAMASWRYPGPWSVYDGSHPLDPAEGYWAVVDGAAGDEVVGFACYGVEARVPGLEQEPGVLDVGVGLRPDLTGQGLGRDFAAAVLSHGATVSGASRLRAVVQDWNARSRRLLASLGFRETRMHRVGDVTYVVHERPVSPAPDPLSANEG